MFIKFYYRYIVLIFLETVEYFWLPSNNIVTKVLIVTN